jgi:replication factor C subunit 2/4
MEELWVEKYRPKVLTDIVGNHEIINEFKIISKNGNIPHMILSGTPGTGKTTSILCLAKILLKEKFHSAFIELNASDERGIEVVRNKIKSFCKKKSILPPNSHKIIFLDEADSMTKAAQQALRRIIELYTSSTRFVMACNNSSNIIEAIQSRCSVKKFSHIDRDSMKHRLAYICDNENKEYTDEGLYKLIDSSHGDMRKVVSYLQSICTVYDMVDKKNVMNIIDMPDLVMINNLIRYCLNCDFENAENSLHDLLKSGYSSLDIVQAMFENIKSMKITDESHIDTYQKLQIISEIGKIEMFLLQGCDSYLQLYALVSRIIILMEE